MSQANKPVLDHIVINVGTALDEAERQYRALGFQLTVRGHHTVGSSNHLAMFGENYLELLGVEPSNAATRPDLLAARRGLHALVFKTSDAEQLCQDLRSRGANNAEMRSFSRPVAEGQQARFRTVSLPDAAGIAGRSFFCEQQTPEFVWRPELCMHSNGVNEIIGFVLVSERPDETLDHYTRWFEAATIETDTDGQRTFQAGEARVVCGTPAWLKSAYGLEVDCPRDQLAVMAALILRTSSTERLLDVLTRHAIRHDTLADGHIVVAPPNAEGVGLIFSAALPA